MTIFKPKFEFRSRFVVLRPRGGDLEVGRRSNILLSNAFALSPGYAQ